MASVVGRDIGGIGPFGRGSDLEATTGWRLRPVEYPSGFRRGDSHQSVDLMLLGCFHILGEIIQQAGDRAGADRPLRLVHLKEIRAQIKVLDLPVELEQRIDAIDFLLVVHIIRDQPYPDTGGVVLLGCADFYELSPL